MLNAVVPVGLVVELRLRVLHGESLLALLARADIGAVAAAETVEDVDLLHETHVGELLAYSGDGVLLLEGGGGVFGLVKHEGTDSGVRADV